MVDSVVMWCIILWSIILILNGILQLNVKPKHQSNDTITCVSPLLNCHIPRLGFHRFTCLIHRKCHTELEIFNTITHIIWWMRACDLPNCIRRGYSTPRSLLHSLKWLFFIVHMGYVSRQTSTTIVCLHARSVRRHTWVQMGPDSNKMLKPGF